MFCANVQGARGDETPHALCLTCIFEFSNFFVLCCCSLWDSVRFSCQFSCFLFPCLLFLWHRSGCEIRPFGKMQHQKIFLVCMGSESFHRDELLVSLGSTGCETDFNSVAVLRRATCAHFLALWLSWFSSRGPCRQIVNRTFGTESPRCDLMICFDVPCTTRSPTRWNQQNLPTDPTWCTEIG